MAIFEAPDAVKLKVYDDWRKPESEYVVGAKILEVIAKEVNVGAIHPNDLPALISDVVMREVVELAEKHGYVQESNK